MAVADRLHAPEHIPTPQEDVVDATPFNENLFMDEDLDGLDDELKELDLGESEAD